MIKADIPIAIQLRKLYELQQIDSQINEFETLKGELPVEVSDLEDELEGLETRSKKLMKALKMLKKKWPNFKVASKTLNL